MADEDRPGKGRPIEAIWAWVATNPGGGETILSARVGGVYLPLIGADIDWAKSVQAYAEAARNQLSCPVRLARFSCREDIEVLT